MTHKKEPSQRQMRIAKLIQEVISTALLENEFFDPLIRGDCISVTGVQISPDLHNATVLITLREDTLPLDNCIRYLNDNFSYKARNIIAKDLRTRYTPNIKFALDQSLKQLRRLDEIFDNLAK